MKTEISRDSHQPGKRYSGVYQQQGRVLADADWNELVEILKDRLNDTLKDVVGNGSPLHRNVVDNTTSPPSLQWGYVYVDGVQAVVRPDDGATLQPVLEYEHQEDFPTAPDLPSAPDDNYVLYADVWERTVTHLMDERLRDKGLHGADTCSRKQTLAQVKWCGVAVDPEQSEKNPVKGDANLSLTLLHKTSESDPCDPCAAELNVESRVGNYLFRVEVHDVKGDADGPSEITLKWSGENGAEQFEAMPTKEHMPVGFISDKWVYEFFDETSEKHLGVHLERCAGPCSRCAYRDQGACESLPCSADSWIERNHEIRSPLGWILQIESDVKNPDRGCRQGDRLIYEQGCRCTGFRENQLFARDDSCIDSARYDSWQQEVCCR